MMKTTGYRKALSIVMIAPLEAKKFTERKQKRNNPDEYKPEA